MTTINEYKHCWSKLSVRHKVGALESTLHQSLVDFKELLLELEQLQSETENYKLEIIKQKEKCESNNCSSSKALKMIIQSKDNIIQLIASSLNKLNETKNLSILSEIFKIIYGNTLTPPKDGLENKLRKIDSVSPQMLLKENNKLTSPKKELCTSIEDVSFKDESVSEIGGAPTGTGRTSPLLQPKKFRSSSSVNPMELKGKKKCPDHWSTPDAKSLKLVYPTTARSKSGGRGRYRQARLPFERERASSVVDLTSSPEFAGGIRELKGACDVQKIIKKESSENDDTILPSPTSGPANFLLSSKENKCRKPLSLARLKTAAPFGRAADAEDSINILQPKRFLKNPVPSPSNSPIKAVAHDEDVTHCDDTSISLLQHVDQLHNRANTHTTSPTKRPLVENINVNNMRSAPCDDSMSLLRDESALVSQEKDAKRKTPEKVEPVFKEPTVRKKAEKMALPAWCCVECEKFFGELYGDEPVMRARTIANCSKHRGRSNPARAATPPGFWHPRWDVPDDTEEFNRRNNAL